VYCQLFTFCTVNVLSIFSSWSSIWGLAFKSLFYHHFILTLVLLSALIRHFGS